MRSAKSNRIGVRGSNSKRRLLLAAAGAVPLLTTAATLHAQSTYYWDINGATAGASGGTTAGGTWDASTANWSLDSTGASATSAWVPGSIADFAAGTNATGNYTVTVNGTQSVGGLVFEEGAVTMAGLANTDSALDFGSGAVTILLPNSGNKNQTVDIPIIGSGSMTIGAASNTQAATFTAADMSGYTGSVTISAGTGPGFPSGTGANKFQVNSTIGDGTQAVTLNSFSLLSNGNQQTINTSGGPITTPLEYSFKNPIILAGSDEWISASGSGVSVSGVAQEQAVTYTGSITGVGGTTANSNLWLGIDNAGGAGTIVLGDATTSQYKYSGATIIVQGNGNNGSPNNSLIRIGQDNILPSGTTLQFGSTINQPKVAVAPIDLNGHTLTVGALNVVTTNANVPLFVNAGVGATPAPASLIVDSGSDSSTTTFSGQIGRTDVANIKPFNVEAPYVGNTTLSSDITLTKAGASNLVLTNVSPYTGNTNVNGGTLTLASSYGTASTPGTISNTVGGDVIVNNGAALATAGGNSTAYWSAAAGRVTVNSGGVVSPGGTGAGGNTDISTVGGLEASALTLESGSDLKFDILSRVNYDSISVANDLTLDSGTHTLDIVGTPGPSATGTFDIMNFASLSDTSSDNVLSDFTLGATQDPTGFYTYSLSYNNPTSPTALLLHIAGGPSVIHWDADTATDGPQEGSGTWSDGDNHWVDVSDDSQHVYSNSDTLPVVIGDDTTQSAGTITLGSDVRVGGVLTFNPVSGNYVIDGGGANHTDHTLTVASGINANNSTTINAPVALEADQTWNVAVGQTLTLGQAVTGGSSLTKDMAGELVLSGAGINLSGTTNVNGGTLTVSGASPTISDIEINNASTVNLNDSSGNITIVDINSGTLAIGDGSALGPEGSSFISINDGATLKFTAPLNLPNDITPISATSGQIINFDTGDNNVTFSGIIQFKGSVNKYGTGDWTLAGDNSQWQGGNGVGILSIEDPSTIHLISGTALGSENLAALGGTTTLDVQTDNRMGAIRNDSYTVIKTGPGKLTLSNSTGATTLNPNALFQIDQGAVEMDTSNSIGGSSGTAASPTQQMPITLNPNTELMTSWTGFRNSTGITMNDSSTLTLLSTSPATGGDTDFENYDTSGSSHTSFGGVFTVNGNVTVRNMAQAVAGDSRDLMITMPINVTAGSTLNLYADNNTGNYETAGVLLRGVDNQNAYPGDALYLQAGSTVISSGTGDINIGSTGRGKPIVAVGPGNVLMQLGSHTFMRELGNASDTSTGSALTKLVIDGANLRIEAPMNATYTDPGTDPAPDLRGYDGTTGLFGVNTTSTVDGVGMPTGYTKLGNGFTVLSAVRAAAISNTYTSPALGGAITPSGTLTLAATDASAAVGVVNAGPAAPCAVGLALDNTATSGDLTYQIDPTANSGTVNNFAGLTVQRTNSGHAVVAQIINGTLVAPQVAVTGGAQLDVNDQKLITNSDIGSFDGTAYTGVTGLIASGRNGGAWNGPGMITSQTYAKSPSILTTLGIATGAQVENLGAGQTAIWGGQTVSDTSTLVMYTYAGDANLDGRINGDDYFAIDSHVNTVGANGYANGDFNLDGHVNGDDYFLIDSNINQQSLGVFPTSAGLAGVAASSLAGVSAVPEPTSVSLLELAGCALLRRRRRNS